MLHQNYWPWEVFFFFKIIVTYVSTLYFTLFTSKVLVTEEALSLSRVCDNACSAWGLGAVIDGRNQRCNVISKGKLTIFREKNIPVSLRAP